MNKGCLIWKNGYLLDNFVILVNLHIVEFVISSNLNI